MVSCYNFIFTRLLFTLLSFNTCDCQNIIGKDKQAGKYYRKTGNAGKSETRSCGV